MTARRVILVGLMGCGKSTVGELLAAALAYRFVDTDAVVAEQEKMSVAEIFRQSGEAAFRRLESEVLAHAVGDDDRVIATGGGAVLSADNRALMRRSGAVVYLQATAAVLAHRVGTAAARPLLAGAESVESVKSRLTDLLQQRESLYRKTAHIVVTQSATDSPPAVAKQVLAELEKFSFAGKSGF